MADAIASIQTAHALLKQFDCRTPGQPLSPDEREAVRAAVLCVTEHSDYQILGICADSADQGILALKDYAAALNLTLPDTVPTPIEGTVYLKLNPKLGRCYLDGYSGVHRGVLISCQSADEDGLNETYGHLPLDLFSGRG